MSGVDDVCAGIERGAGLWRLARGRLAARLLRLRGARLGAKCVVGARCRVLRPRGLQAGARCTLEDDVFVKIAGGAGRVVLGEQVFLGRGCELDVLREVAVGDHTVIGPGVFVVDHDHGLRADLRIDEQPCAEAPVRIGRDVWVGARAVILAGVSVGDGAVVGAGAVVTRDVEPLAIVAGVPARAVGRRGDGARAVPPC
jgi:maltose O-acetyltransferase